MEDGTCEIKEERIEDETELPVKLEDDASCEEDPLESKGQENSDDRSGSPTVDEMAVDPIDIVKNELPEEGGAGDESLLKSLSRASTKRNGQVKRSRKSKEKNHSCEFCNYTCYRSSDLKRHVRTHTGERPFGCHLCDYASARSSHLKLHLRTHSGEKPYKCELCDYASADSSHLNIHMKTHSDDRPHACEVCGLAFKRNWDLNVHVQKIHMMPHAHDDPRPHPGKLKSHMKRRHPESLLEPEVVILKQKPVDDESATARGDGEHQGEANGEAVTNVSNGDESPPTPFIDTTFSLSVQDKRTRLSTTTNEKVWNCEFCPYTCTRLSDLKIHVRTHTGERPFGCHLCPYSGTRASHLKIHMRTHTGEKPYKCDICDYASSDSGHLKAHKKIHSDDRPHACTVCGLAFKRTHDLTMHMRIHTGERPHVCSFCNFASNRPGHLKTHIKRHHTQAILEPELQITEVAPDVTNEVISQS